MHNRHRDVLAALRRVSGELIAASDAQARANRAMVEAFEAPEGAVDDTEDLGETVRRLEQLVIQQGEEFRKLRDDLTGGR